MPVQSEVRLTYRLHKAQMRFHRSPAKYRAFLGGIGSGKTFMGCLEAILYSINHPGSLGMVVAPSFPMLRDSTMRKFWELCPREIIESWKESTKELKLINGSEVLFRSADNPESLRGPNLAYVYGDEASLWKRMVWDIAVGRLRQPGFPQRAWITCTPKGFNWVYDLFSRNRTSDHALIHCPTAENYHNLPEDYIRTLQAQYSGLFFKQELLGEFVAFEGLVYPEFSVDHIIDENPEWFAAKRVIAGLDFGFHNPTAIEVIALDGDDRAVVIDEHYQRQMSLNQLINACLDLKERHNIDMFYADPSEPANIKALSEAGVPTVAARNDVQPGIAEVAGRWRTQDDGRSRLYVRSRCANLVAELQQYRYNEEVEGKTVKEEPIKVNDHACDAIRYALFSLNRGMVQMVGGFGGGLL